MRAVDYLYGLVALVGAVALGLLMAAVVAVGVSLKPPPPATTPASRQEQTQGASEHQVRNYNDGPAPNAQATILQRKTSVNTTQRNSEGAESQQDAATDWNRLVALGTIALAVFALIQVIVYGFQAYYMRSGLRITETAANAAKKSADVAEQALHLAERAYIEVAPEMRHGDEGEIVTMHVFYRITNTGRTPADITRAAVRWHFNNGEVPGPPQALDSDSAAIGQICANGSRVARGIIPGGIRKAQFTDCEAGRLGCWVSIVVDFTDAFRKKDSQEFWWRYFPDDGFVRCPPPPPEQRKERAD